MELLIRLPLVVSVIVVLLVGQVALVAADPAEADDDKSIKTITRKDKYGVAHIEHAFNAPSKGLPTPVLDLFCSSVKLRLYWKGYRQEIKKTHRKGIYLRRMARFAKHVFKDVRDVDKPFNATMLSIVDRHFAAKFDQSSSSEDEFEDDDDDEKVKDKDKEKDKDKDRDSDHADLVLELDDSASKQPMFKSIKSAISKTLHNMNPKNHDVDNEILEEIDSSSTVKELKKQGQHPAIETIKKFAKSWNFKKAALLVYTRFTTMWWLSLSCLYTKYFLWDPALDEFIKLKRSLLMWPELQLVKLQDLQCKPVMFFRRIMDICKILNPLMRMSFGQFNYDSLTRFKGS